MRKAASKKHVRKSKLPILSPTYKDTVEVIRSNWKGLRQTRRLSQSQLAKLIGITQQRVQALETRDEKIPLHWIVDGFAAMNAPVHLAFVPGSFRPRETHSNGRQIR